MKIQDIKNTKPSKRIMRIFLFIIILIIFLIRYYFTGTNKNNTLWFDINNPDTSILYDYSIQQPGRMLGKASREAYGFFYGTLLLFEDQKNSVSLDNDYTLFSGFRMPIFNHMTNSRSEEEIEMMRDRFLSNVGNDFPRNDVDIFLRDLAQYSILNPSQIINVCNRFEGEFIAERSRKDFCEQSLRVFLGVKYLEYPEQEMLDNFYYTYTSSSNSKILGPISISFDIPVSFMQMPGERDMVVDKFLSHMGPKILLGFEEKIGSINNKDMKTICNSLFKELYYFDNSLRSYGDTYDCIGLGNSDIMGSSQEEVIALYHMFFIDGNMYYLMFGADNKNSFESYIKLFAEVQKSLVITEN